MGVLSVFICIVFVFIVSQLGLLKLFKLNHKFSAAYQEILRYKSEAAYFIAKIHWKSFIGVLIVFLLLFLGHSVLGDMQLFFIAAFILGIFSCLWLPEYLRMLWK